MRKIIKWTMAGLLFILSVVVVIFLPEYITKKNDRGYMNQYHLYPQDRSVTVNMDLTVEEKLEIIFGQERISVMYLDKVKDLEANDEKLLPELSKQLEMMEKDGLLPIDSASMDLNAIFDSAEMYACTLKSKPGKIFYVWNIMFYLNGGEENYTFLVDTVTYQIYEAFVHNKQAALYIQKIWEQSEEENYKLLTEWSVNYEKYLGSQNSSEDSTKAGEAQENRLDYYNIDSMDYGEFWMNSILLGHMASYEIQCSSYSGYDTEETGGNFYFVSHPLDDSGVDSENDLYDETQNMKK